MRKHITFNDKMIEMIEVIKEDNALPSFAAAVHHAVVIAFRKVRPAYAGKIKDLPADEQLKRKETLKEATNKRMLDKSLDICNALGGEIVNNGGTKVCHFFNYSKTSRYPQKMPLDQLTDDLIGLQYFPTKEIVEKYQKEGKTEYAVKKKKS